MDRPRQHEKNLKSQGWAGFECRSLWSPQRDPRTILPYTPRAPILQPNRILRAASHGQSGLMQLLSSFLLHQSIQKRWLVEVGRRCSVKQRADAFGYRETPKEAKILCCESCLAKLDRPTKGERARIRDQSCLDQSGWCPFPEHVHVSYSHEYGSRAWLHNLGQRVQEN